MRSEPVKSPGIWTRRRWHQRLWQRRLAAMADALSEAQSTGKPAAAAIPPRTLAGIAQIAFCERALAGGLILAAVATLSPAAALGALAGALAGTVLAPALHTWNAPERAAGLPGANPAIVGILWAELAWPAGWPYAGWVALALLPACLVLERVLKPVLAGAGLPLLSAPAVLAGFALAAAHAVLDLPLWQVPYGVLEAPWRALPAAVLVLAGLGLQAPAAALQSGWLVAATALGSGALMQTGVPGPVGLWAFAVAPAAFGVHAVFLAESRLGARAALACAALSAGLWAAWVSSPLAMSVPPLLAPFIVATWAVLGICRHRLGPLLLEPALWAAARALRGARARGAPVLALTGAGISTASGIPDYVSGAWTDPHVPVRDYAWDRFLASPRCRRLYWDACARFRRVSRAALPSRGHRALAALEAAGWVDATVTQNVDRLHQAAGGRRVVEIHGDIERVRCTGCGAPHAWPAQPLWRSHDLRCAACGGLVKPAVVAFGEPIPPLAWERARALSGNCAVLLVVGTRLAVSSAQALLAEARAAGARVICVNAGELSVPLAAGDLVIRHDAEAALPALARLLDCDPTQRPSTPLQWSVT